jgi:ATP-dependent Lon protease
MFESGDFSISLDDFRGIARLFPLPNVTVFPHVMQPLHVFEPRYRALFADALSGDKLIAMATLSPGWEETYDQRPVIFPHACLCRIATHTKLDDGCYNTLLIGLRRLKIVKELPPTKMFREAQVELLDDEYSQMNAPSRPGLQRRLVERFKRIVPKMAEAQEQLDQLLGSDVPLGLLTDLVAYTVDLPLATKMALLSEINVDRRAELLLQNLGLSIGSMPGSKFPPDFSAN